MVQTKNKIILNTEYYSADAHVEEDEINIINREMVIKIIIVFFVLLISLLGYNYFIKGSKSSLVLLSSETKNVPIIKVAVSSKIDSTKKEKISTKNTKPLHHDELSDEYIKLVQQSLGNY